MQVTELNIHGGITIGRIWHDDDTELETIRTAWSAYVKDNSSPSIAGFSDFWTDNYPDEYSIGEMHIESVFPAKEFKHPDIYPYSRVENASVSPVKGVKRYILKADGREYSYNSYVDAISDLRLIKI